MGAPPSGAKTPDGGFVNDVHERATEVGGGGQVRRCRDGDVIGSRAFPLPAHGASQSGRRRACTHAQALAQDGRASPESGPVGRVEAGRTGNGACWVGPPSLECTKGAGGPFFTPSETGIANAT